jgi:hypothetical protein
MTQELELFVNDQQFVIMNTFTDPMGYFDTMYGIIS